MKNRNLFGCSPWSWMCSLSLVCGLSGSALADEGFTDLFNGENLEGWKINENPAAWSIVDGTIKSNGDRSHLFYVGDDQPFTNFELRVDVKTENNSNAGIYFHTQYQETGWPKFGFEAQVNNTFNADPKKTGSLYGVQNVLEAPAKDGEWFTETVIVNGKHVVIKINDKQVVDYTEPEGYVPGTDFTRAIASGTFALQAHDPGSTVYFKNIRVKRLD